MKKRKMTLQERKGLNDIIIYTGVMALIVVGFIMDFQFAKIVFWGLIGLEAGLLGLNWILVIVAPHFIRAEIGAKTLERIGMLRTTNYAVNMIFKIPMILALTYLSQCYAAVVLVSTIFFEEHRIVLIEKSFFIIKNNK